MSSQTFALDIRAFVEKAKAAPTQVVRRATLDLLRSIVLRSPVGNPDLWKSKPPAGYVGGRFRANWNVSLVDPDISTTEVIDKDGGETIARGLTVLTHADGTQDIYITNNLPYAAALEWGHSGVQAPQGMVRVSIAEFGQYIDNAIQELPK
ncbi:hypothetical protein [Dyella sp. EPa41]|uniref:hypothetical protein n=1 Tax=Dyella sp. EPa41 TaxID=1561194 RepID=UPI001915090D|nr:hypothetical protein [Dyella sp. EPa41]